jgi:hypothetical protein
MREGLFGVGRLKSQMFKGTNGWISSICLISGSRKNDLSRSVDLQNVKVEIDQWIDVEKF